MSHTSNDTTRICEGCQRELPLTDEYFYRVKGVGNKTYFRNPCKNCYREITRDGHARRFAENPEKRREQHRRWVAAHPEEYKIAKARWDVNNPEKILEKNRKWRAANPEKARENYRRAYPKYYATHKEVAQAKHHRRRAIEANALGAHTAAELKTLYYDMEGRCGYCGIPIYLDMKNDSHLDHMMPLSREGTNDISNLCYACPDCNLSKHDKTVEEWQIVRGW